MVRRTVRRRTARRRRRGTRRRMTRRISNAPPRLSIASNTRRIVIPYTKAYDSTNKTPIKIDLTIAELLNHQPNTGLKLLYGEVKIRRVFAYWQSNNTYADSGSVVMIVEDYAENSGASTNDFDKLAMYPGAMIRKVWQNVSNVWYPTEPDDKNWFKLNSGVGICTISVVHSTKTTGVLNGTLICRVEAVMRGRTDVTSALAELANENLYKGRLAFDDGRIVVNRAPFQVQKGLPHHAMSP